MKKVIVIKSSSGVRKKLTQTYLKKLLFYSPEEGTFTWGVSRANNSIKAGAVAGNVHYPSGYRRIHIDGKSYKASRLAYLYMTGAFPPEQMDHKNRIRDDNAWDNLRAVSQSENMRNFPLTRRNNSGTKGVEWWKHGEKWRARIMIRGKRFRLGNFKNKIEAIRARREAEERYGYIV